MILKLLKNLHVIAIIGIINILVLMVPAAGVYYLLGGFGLPQIYTMAISLFVAAIFGGVWASIIIVGHEMNTKEKQQVINDASRGEIQRRIQELKIRVNPDGEHQ